MATIQKRLDMNTTKEKVFKLLTDPTGRHVGTSPAVAVTRFIASQERERGTCTRLISPCLLVTCSLMALLLSTLALLLGPTPPARAAAQARAAGYVFVLNNDLSGSNSITTFSRAGDGSLSLLGTTSIGGLGSLAAFADGTQGSLILTHDRTRLFGVDAGSDEISVVNVHDGHLSLAGVFPSGGAGRISLTYQDGLLYVLNAANASTTATNVAGFHVDADGTLHPIAGATKFLSVPHPNPAQVQID